MSNTPVTLNTGLSAAVAVRLYALDALTRCEGDRAKAALSLDVDITTLRKWLKELEVGGVTIPEAPRRQGRPRKAITLDLQMAAGL